MVLWGVTGSWQLPHKKTQCPCKGGPRKLIWQFPHMRTFSRCYLWEIASTKHEASFGLVVPSIQILSDGVLFGSNHSYGIWLEQPRQADSPLPPMDNWSLRVFYIRHICLFSVVLLHIKFPGFFPFCFCFWCFGLFCLYDFCHVNFSVSRD